MMVRDVGHALILDIDTSKPRTFVSYFIPKITNVKLVNQLLGVKKVDEKSECTTGMFELEEGENIGKGIVDFIEKVPTDAEMFIEGGKSYRPQNTPGESEWTAWYQLCYNKTRGDRMTAEYAHLLGYLKEAKVQGETEKED